MVVAALVSFGLLFVAWLMAPSSDRTSDRVGRPAEIRATQDTALAAVPVEAR